MRTTDLKGGKKERKMFSQLPKCCSSRCTTQLWFYYQERKKGNFRSVVHKQFHGVILTTSVHIIESNHFKKQNC